MRLYPGLHRAIVIMSNTTRSIGLDSAATSSAAPKRRSGVSVNKAAARNFPVRAVSERGFPHAGSVRVAATSVVRVSRVVTPARRG